MKLDMKIVVPFAGMAGCFGFIGLFVILASTILLGILSITGIFSHHPLQANISSGGNMSVVQAAITLENQLYGEQTNQYDPGNPVLHDVIEFWSTHTCGSQPGMGVNGLCSVVWSGDLQCVQFVQGAFAMANDILPTKGNAIDFWELYKKRPGWIEVPGNIYDPDQRGLPQPGDIAIWSSPPVPVVDDGKQERNPDGSPKFVIYGHDAIVVSVQPPSGNTPGSVTFAQANGPGNTFSSKQYPTRTGNFSVQTLYPDLSISTGADYPFYGYIRQANMGIAYRLPRLDDPTGDTPSIDLDHIFPDVSQDNRQWIRAAFNAAINHQISPLYFIKQIHLMSNFNPDFFDSNTGRIGIALLLPDMANCVDRDPNTHKCNKVDRMDPNQALDGAARWMETYYLQYLNGYAANLADPSQEAEAMALAAYDSPSTVVLDDYVKNCPNNWRDCLKVDAATAQYVHDIMD